MSEVTIINVYDGINASTYTFNQYYTDTRNGPGKTDAEDNALAAVNAMGQYWVSQHGGTYLGFDAEEGGYVVKDPQGEVAMIYYLQTLTFAGAENLADKII